MQNFWSTNSGFCKFETFELLKDDPVNPGQYIAGNDIVYLTNNASNHIGGNSSRLYFWQNLPTPVSEWTTGSKRYIRATTFSGKQMIWTFYIKICGAETVTTTMPSKPNHPYYFYLYAESNGTPVKYLIRDSINDFINDN